MSVVHGERYQHPLARLSTLVALLAVRRPQFELAKLAELTPVETEANEGRGLKLCRVLCGCCCCILATPGGEKRDWLLTPFFAMSGPLPGCLPKPSWLQFELDCPLATPVDCAFRGRRDALLGGPEVEDV